MLLVLRSVLFDASTGPEYVGKWVFRAMCAETVRGDARRDEARRGRMTGMLGGVFAADGWVWSMDLPVLRMVGKLE